MGAKDMQIVDAQVHIWAGGKPSNPNHRQVPAFTKDELLKEMDEAGVDAAVIHPPTSWDPNANEQAIEAARQHPDRLAILGNFPLDRPESRALVDGWKQRPGMLGLRFTFLQPHQKTWPTDGTIDWLWPAAERAELPIALLAFGFLPKLAQVAERHPRLRLIIDHLGRSSPAMKDDAAWATLPDMLALAKHPDVAIKATELVNFAQGDLLMLGAFTCYMLVVWYGVGYWLAFVLAVAAVAVFGAVLDATVLRRVIGQPQFALVMLTIGLAAMFRAFASITWGSEIYTLPTPFSAKATRIGGVAVSHEYVSIIVGTVLLCGALYAFFTFTRVGVAMQAASQNQLAAYYMGIPVKRMFSLVLAISAGVAAIAGVPH